MRSTTAVCAVVKAAVGVLLAAVAGAAPPTTATKVKPDLVAASVTAARERIRPEGVYQVRVTVKVALRAAGDVSTGPFKVRVEYRDAPLLAVRSEAKSLAVWTLLQEGGVAGMTFSTASSRLPGETRTFSDTVPPGVVRTYRAKVDSMDQVEEADETNNQATATFRAEGCSGVDLVVTRVKLRRSARGTVGKVWVANRCLATCECVVQWGPVRAPSPDYVTYSDVGQVIARRLGGEQTAESPNWLDCSDGSVVVDPAAVPPPESGAAAAPSDETWVIWVSMGSPGCAETNGSNNSCRATIRAGQESSVTECAR